MSIGEPRKDPAGRIFVASNASGKGRPNGNAEAKDRNALRLMTIAINDRQQVSAALKGGSNGVAS